MKNLIKIFISRNLLFDLKFIFLKFSKNYITTKIRGSHQDYINLFDSINDKYKINKFIRENFNQKEINFITELAKITQISIKKSPPNFYHGFIIFEKLRSYILNNSNDKILIFETGTAKGFSSTLMSYCASNLLSEYEIHTIDMIPNNVKILWNSLSDVENGKVTRQDLLKEYVNYLDKIIYHVGNSRRVLKKIDLKRINFAFLDGSHEYDDCKLEFNYINKRNQKGDIIIFDDYTQNRFDGVCKLVNEVLESKKYYHEIFEENHNRGYAILTKK